MPRLKSRFLVDLLLRERARSAVFSCATQLIAAMEAMAPSADSAGKTAASGSGAIRLSAWRNRSNTNGRNSGAIPFPESAMRTSAWSASRASVIRIPDPYNSDHYPLVLRLALPAPGPDA